MSSISTWQKWRCSNLQASPTLLSHSRSVGQEFPGGSILIQRKNGIARICFPHDGRCRCGKATTSPSRRTLGSQAGTHEKERTRLCLREYGALVGYNQVPVGKVQAGGNHNEGRPTETNATAVPLHVDVGRRRTMTLLGWLVPLLWKGGANANAEGEYHPVPQNGRLRRSGMYRIGESSLSGVAAGLTLSEPAS
jgi:hypothetical protein